MPLRAAFELIKFAPSFSTCLALRATFPGDRAPRDPRHVAARSAGKSMSEKPESDEFEDEEADEPVVSDGDVDLDQVIKDLDMAKRRGQKTGDPAWRRLERLLEDKRTAELTSDFEDYDIGVDGDDDEDGDPGPGHR